MRTIRHVSALILITAGFTLGSGCDGLFTDSNGTGTLRVLLTDNPFPFDLVNEANATISRVDIVVAGEGSVTVMDEPKEFNLLELRDGVTAMLGEIELPAGTHSQIRLVVSDASVVLIDGTEFDLKVPSGAQTGIKINTPELHVEADMTTVITLDFDVDESFVAQGSVHAVGGITGFIFTPVINPLSVEYTSQPYEEDEKE